MLVPKRDETPLLSSFIAQEVTVSLTIVSFHPYWVDHCIALVSTVRQRYMPFVTKKRQNQGAIYIKAPRKGWS